MNNIGGYTTGWPVGSLFESEGKKLYDLVIEHKPKVIVEIGTLDGCSTTWLAAAVKENGIGHVYSIDNWQERGDKTGILIPAELKEYITLIKEDALTYTFDKKIDMLFEDGAHTTGFTSTILKRFKSKLVVVHDFFHWDCQTTVHDEAISVLGEPAGTLLEAPSDCGLAWWEL